METSVVWFVLGLALVAAELFTGTFYLLMVAIGFAAGGLMAWAGSPMVAQFVVGAVVGLIAVLLLRRVRGAHVTDKPEAASNPDLLLDIGQAVHVSAWHHGRAKVQYRGAQWDAQLASGDGGRAPADYRIVAVNGSVLVLSEQV